MTYRLKDITGNS